MHLRGRLQRPLRLRAACRHDTGVPWQASQEEGFYSCQEDLQRETEYCSMHAQRHIAASIMQPMFSACVHKMHGSMQGESMQATCGRLLGRSRDMGGRVEMGAAERRQAALC